MVTTGAMPAVPSSRAARRQGAPRPGFFLAPVRTCRRNLPFPQPADREVRPAGTGPQGGRRAGARIRAVKAGGQSTGSQPCIPSGPAGWHGWQGGPRRRCGAVLTGRARWSAGPAARGPVQVCGLCGGSLPPHGRKQVIAVMIPNGCRPVSPAKPAYRPWCARLARYRLSQGQGNQSSGRSGLKQAAYMSRAGPGVR